MQIATLFMQKFTKKVQNMTYPQNIGVQVKNKPGQWVQTERKAHEAWANLIARKPRAAMLMHHLVAKMGHQNAVVISQKTLSSLWEQAYGRPNMLFLISRQKNGFKLRMNGPGTVSAYIVNDRVAWGQARDQLRLSVFSATVVADIEDQDATTLQHDDLRRIPSLYPGERQLPTGDGEEPPSQPCIEGMEPDL